MSTYRTFRNVRAHETPVTAGHVSSAGAVMSPLEVSAMSIRVELAFIVIDVIK